MKKILIVYLLSMNIGFCADAQNSIFKTVQLERGVKSLNKIDKSKNNEDSLYYKIVLSSKPVGSMCSYPLIIDENVFSNIDTLKAIEELLSFEGDNRICVLSVVKYNNRTSNFWIEEKKDYSIQLEALYIINILALEKPFGYSPIPALEDIKSKEKATISGEIIKKAYKAYRQWFNTIKIQGLKKTLKDRYYPLDNSDITWY